MPTYLHSYLSKYLSVYHPLIYLSIYPSIYVSVCLSVCLSIHLAYKLHIHMLLMISIQRVAHIYICIFTYIYIHIFRDLGPSQLTLHSTQTRPPMPEGKEGATRARAPRISAQLPIWAVCRPTNMLLGPRNLQFHSQPIRL